VKNKNGRPQVLSFSSDLWPAGYQGWLMSGKRRSPRITETSENHLISSESRECDHFCFPPGRQHSRLTRKSGQMGEIIPGPRKNSPVSLQCYIIFKCFACSYNCFARRTVARSTIRPSTATAPRPSVSAFLWASSTLMARSISSRVGENT
jgi:hypothetical protein